jgi:hypothetical protein
MTKYYKLNDKGKLYTLLYISLIDLIMSVNKIIINFNFVFIYVLN